METVTQLFDGLILTDDMKAITIMFSIAVVTLLLGLIIDLVR